MKRRTFIRQQERNKLRVNHEPDDQWWKEWKCTRLTKDGPVKEYVKLHPGAFEPGPNRAQRRAKLGGNSWDYSNEVPPMWEVLFKRTTNLIRATFTPQPEDPKPEPRVNYWGRVTGKLEAMMAS